MELEMNHFDSYQFHNAPGYENCNCFWKLETLFMHETFFFLLIPAKDLDITSFAQKYTLFDSC